MHITVSAELPDQAQVMRDYTVERCHQFAQQQPPSDKVLIDDLIMLAYAEGADGLSNLRFERESGLLRNCWSIARGTATFFRLPKRAQ